METARGIRYNTPRLVQLTRTAPVVRYKSDALTRAFFKSQPGPEFHFTYRLNEFRRSAPDSLMAI